MRHGDKINNLGRKKAHRDALLANLVTGCSGEAHMTVKLLVCDDDQAVADLVVAAAELNWPSCQITIA